MKHAVFAKKSISEVFLEEPSRFAKNGQKVVPTFLLSHPQGFFAYFYKPLTRTFCEKVESKNCEFRNFSSSRLPIDHRQKISALLKKVKKRDFLVFFRAGSRSISEIFVKKHCFFINFS
jgi:hypothetical protein